MDYQEIKTKLKKYSFDSKMQQAFVNSQAIMTYTGLVGPDKLIEKVLPDELETYVVLAIIAKEWKYDSLDDGIFSDMIFGIRSSMDSKLKSAPDDDLAKWAMILISANQFEHEEYSLYRLYRHYYYFTFKNDRIDVEKEFVAKFGEKYDTYVSIIWIFWTCLCGKENETFNRILKKAFIKYPKIIQTLTMSREDYEKELSEFAENIEDYRFCLKPSYSYPFVEYEKGYFLPTPHLLLQAITTAMMNRLTFNNDSLRDVIGKEVAESYLYNVVKDSGFFDEVIAEQEYVINGNSRRTIDVMARKDNYVVMLDSKSFVPKVTLRVMNKKSYDDEIARVGKHCKQVYEQTKLRFLKEYNYFKKEDFQWNNVFGLVVLANDPYLPNHEIYEWVAEKEGIQKESDDYRWMTEHIGIVSISLIEACCLTGSDMVALLKSRKGIDDKWLLGELSSKKNIPVICRFNKKLTAISKEMLFKLGEIA